MREARFDDDRFFAFPAHGRERKRKKKKEKRKKKRKRERESCGWMSAKESDSRAAESEVVASMVRYRHGNH
jgi:hypothetical protein